MAALDQFIASFNRYGGHAQLNRFEVEIFSPFEANPNIADDRHFSFRVEGVTMPGKNIRSTTNENIYGPTHEMAQGLTYAEEVNMTILLSAQHFEKHYVHQWMDYIVKPNTYDLEYYQSYIKPIAIFQLDKNEQRGAGVRLNECFPKTLGPIQFSNNGVNELAKQEVSFAFKDIEFLNADGDTVSIRDNDAGKFPRQMQIPTMPFSSYDDAFMGFVRSRVQERLTTIDPIQSARNVIRNGPR